MRLTQDTLVSQRPVEHSPFPPVPQLRPPGWAVAKSVYLPSLSYQVRCRVLNKAVAPPSDVRGAVDVARPFRLKPLGLGPDFLSPSRSAASERPPRPAAPWASPWTYAASAGTPARERAAKPFRVAVSTMATRKVGPSRVSLPPLRAPGTPPPREPQGSPQGRAGRLGGHIMEATIYEKTTKASSAWRPPTSSTSTRATSRSGSTS